ncbi:MAG: SDR family oxidoreductase [Hyphomicrobiales bacterium]|nr:SDR family oxidoreductase [Hyphomicrobiales bacterium]
MSTLVAFGLGYSATALGGLLRSDGWQVIGTGRSPSSLARTASDGLKAMQFDGENVSEELLQAIEAATHIVVSAPPGEKGDPVLRQCGDAIASAPELQWIGYLSTIGVYGDHGGAWVDETTSPNPYSARSRERLAAENAWAKLGTEMGVPTQIFRLAGIYGPGRSQLEKLLAGEKHSVFKPGQVFNRIHVDDIAAVLYAAIEKTQADASLEGVFNVTDDEPAPPQDVTAYAASLLGMPTPPLVSIEDANLSLMARSFYSENKRVHNERIKRDLGVTLAHPTYREGLAAIYGELRNRGAVK